MSDVLLQKVSEMVLAVLTAKGVEPNAVNSADFLYEGGLGLDSLDAATLAAMLDNEFNCDPYNSGEFPQTISEIVDFYSSRSIPVNGK
ncbi:MAG TPA: phosphopantetheine-binding protein [Vicinamibacterales bacterium]